MSKTSKELIEELRARFVKSPDKFWRNVETVELRALFEEHDRLVRQVDALNRECEDRRQDISRLKDEKEKTLKLLRQTVMMGEPDPSKFDKLVARMKGVLETIIENATKDV